jgi:hypothetical protein
MKRPVVLAAMLTASLAGAQGVAGYTAFDDGTNSSGGGGFFARANGPSDSGYPCDFSVACNASNNLLSHPEDFANGAWSTFGSGAAAPTVSAATTAVIDGQTVTCNRVQWPAVAAGQESSLYQRLAGDACKRKTCTKSLYLRSHSGASVATGNLPLANAQGGGDGQGYQPCPFTSSFSRCALEYASVPNSNFDFFWLGYVASQSGTSAALDLDICGPKAEYGGGGATAYQCPSPLQVAGVPAHTGYTESQLVLDWGINQRDGAGLFRADDGTLVLMGGWRGSTQAEWGNHVTTNQIYKSSDDGATWSVVQAHADNPAQTGVHAMWRRRHSACWLDATVSGTHYFYVIGGDGFDDFYNSTGDGVPPYPTDVWRTPAATYGAADTWTRMTATAEWGNTPVAADNDGGLNGRVLHDCWADDSGNLYVGFGQTNFTTSTVRTDYYKSINGGATWTLMGNAPFAGRGTHASALPRFLGKTWMVSGEQYDNDVPSRVYFPDAWSFNDTSWSIGQPDAGVGFARGYANAVAWNGRLWQVKGYPAANSNELYSSAEGICWRKERARVGSAEHAASVGISIDGGALIVTGSSTSASVTSIHAP